MDEKEEVDEEEEEDARKLFSPQFGVSYISLNTE